MHVNFNAAPLLASNSNSPFGAAFYSKIAGFFVVVFNRYANHKINLQAKPPEF